MTWQQPPPGHPPPQGYPPAPGAPMQPQQPPPKKPTSPLEIVGLLLALVGVLGLCGVCALAGARRPPDSGGSTATATAPRVAPAGKPPTYKRLGTFAKNGSGELWDNVQVSPKITRDELVTLARHLYYQDPARPVRFFTDGSQYEKYRLYDIHYGTPQASSYPYPKAWVEQHYIARMNCMVVSGGCEWRLSQVYTITPRFGADETLAYLE